MNKKDEAIYNRIHFCVELIMNSLVASEVEIGFDLETRKLVLKDIFSNNISRIDLEKLNKVVLETILDNK